MNVNCEGGTRLFFVLCEWLSTGSQRAEKNTPSTAHQKGGKSVACTARGLPLLQRVPTNANATVACVLQTSLFSHVRDHVNTEQGNRVRRHISCPAQEVCALCGRRGQAWPVESHAVWHDDDTKHAQTLVGLRGVCPACHAVKHLGLAAIAAYVTETQAR
jgi:hypothetical protein